MDWAVPGSGAATVGGALSPELELELDELDELLDEASTALTTEDGVTTLALATTVTVREALLMTTACWCSCWSRATVLVLVMASRPAAAPEAPEEEGPIIQAAADTPPTAIAATTAAGRMTPLRRIKRLVRRPLRAPVRCRDKAILSSAKRTERVRPGTKTAAVAQGSESEGQVLHPAELTSNANAVPD